MDINKLRPIKISPNAKGKVICDFYPDFAEEEITRDDNLNEKAKELHAGAFCLYAATLATKIYETNPEKIDAEYTDRYHELISLIKTSPKHSSLTDNEISNMAKQMIIKDIRNSFAHGNFEISYDVYTKKLYFVLQPKRKDYISNKPIVISKDALYKLNKNFVENIANKVSYLGRENFRRSFSNNLSSRLKDLMLPVEMLKLVDHYLYPETRRVEKYNPNPKRILFIQYILNVTKITYEQDDYYKIFGKDSNIFEKIAIIRNAVAHNNFTFTDDATNIKYDDRSKTLAEPLIKTLSSLKIANSQKELIMDSIYKNDCSQETLQDMADVLNTVFNKLFVEMDWEEVISTDFDQ